MKLAIMQPYFLPYTGYWQLLNVVDKFVVYDDIQFTKKGWIHRNRFLQNGKDTLFSLSLRKDSDYLDINKRFLAEGNDKNIEKIVRQIENSYRKAPFFSEVMPVLLQCFNCSERNLFDYVLNSINHIKNYLGIKTPIITSSELKYDTSLKAQDKVLDICRVCEAEVYINTIGGKELYDKSSFAKKGFELKFIKMKNIKYSQFNHDFVPALSIIDVMMFNSVSEVCGFLDSYTLD